MSEFSEAFEKRWPVWSTTPKFPIKPPMHLALATPEVQFLVVSCKVGLTKACAECADVGAHFDLDRTLVGLTRAITNLCSPEEQARFKKELLRMVPEGVTEEMLGFTDGDPIPAEEREQAVLCVLLMEQTMRLLHAGVLA